MKWMNNLPNNKYFNLQFRGNCIFLIVCMLQIPLSTHANTSMLTYVYICMRYCVSPLWRLLLLLPTCSRPFYSVQAVTQTAVTQVVTSPFTSSPANQGSALMSAWSLRKDAPSSRGPSDLVLTRTHTLAHADASAKAAFSAWGKAKPLMSRLINKKRERKMLTIKKEEKEEAPNKVSLSACVWAGGTGWSWRMEGGDG